MLEILKGYQAFTQVVFILTCQLSIGLQSRPYSVSFPLHNSQQIFFRFMNLSIYHAVEYKGFIMPQNIYV